MNSSTPKFFILLLAILSLTACSGSLPTEEEYYDQKLVAVASSDKRFSHSNSDFAYNKKEFQFVIVGNRTSGDNPGVFSSAMKKVNLLRPEFVIGVGDLIEGETSNVSTLEHQWADVEGMVAKLNTRYYYVAGDQDIDSKTAEDLWERRRGPTYYHFVYRNVLFLVLNTDNESQADISAEQLKYMKDAIADNKGVRWTMVFMHKPAWENSNAGFGQLEKSLQSRPYTMVAGHNNSYKYEKRFGRDYVSMGTTGAASKSSDKNSADHIALVTVTDDGPLFANIELDGLHSINGL